MENKESTFNMEENIARSTEEVLTKEEKAPREKLKRRRLVRKGGESEDAGAVPQSSDDEESKPKKKRKKTESKDTAKAKGKKKGARTAYAVFCQDRRDDIKEENSTLSSGEIQKLLAEEWKNIDKAERQVYKAKAVKDEARYNREFEEWKTENLEEAVEIRKEKSKRKRAAGKKEKTIKKKASKEKRKPKKRKERSEEGDGSGQEDAGEKDGEKKEKKLSLFDQGEAVLKASRRKKKTEFSEQELNDMTTFFLTKMQMASEEDIVSNLHSKPAMAKRKMLPEVIAQVAKTGMQDRLLGFGLLRAILGWLRPLPRDGSLPNVAIRKELYKLLDNLTLTQEDFDKNKGEQIMGLWLHPKETPENKTMLHGLIQKWSYLFSEGTTNYKKLAEVEREKALEIIQRKAQIRNKPYNPRKKNGNERPQIPERAVYDYANRPASSIDENPQKEKMKPRSANTKEKAKSAKIRIAKQLERARQPMRS